ncbi:sensor domain-containing diguanylate cyclase [Rheinheimera sp. 4Y26]|uniref:GGDEF domain-containing protein n=1 Tax=Rheinheimera sp. 4Y26 TaxID=2977811 RepID=UPI0021B14936|nr:diguanylate cyclase [Rheinheimera sp. 4Y26]MCT6700171.1 diguanylate cyclase [Rheinheimera sp. 4Y26]
MNSLKPMPVRRRYSITMMLSLTSLLVLLLFIAMAVLVQNRLGSFQNLLQNITGSAIPAVVQSSKVYSQINQLLYLTEALSRSPSQAVRHNLYQDIQLNLQGLQSLTKEWQTGFYQNAQLVALTEEIDNLNQLMSERLELQSKVQTSQQQIYQLYEQVQLYTSKLALADEERHSPWLLEFAAVVTLSGKASDSNRMMQLRQLKQQVEQQMLRLRQARAVLPTNQLELAEQSDLQLRSLLLESEGLLPLREQQLAIGGRATGRGNFVRNLVLDYARLAENSAYDISGTVLADAAQIQQQLQQDNRQILSGALLVIVFLLVAIALIHRRVVRRLEQLNHNVLLQVQGKAAAHQIEGHDEIAAIARSFAYFASTVAAQQQELQQLSYTDSLTGLANRRAFEQQFHQALVQAQRQQWPLTLLMIDVDCFKAYNDHYGHQAGDDTLVRVAALLQQGINRGSDLVARYGGEEFIAILPDTNAAGASAIASHLLLLFRQAALPHQFNQATDHVSISIGICCVDEASKADYDSMLRRADNALYQAKANGRNGFAFSEH